MKHRRRGAVIVAGTACVAAVSACVVAGQGAETSAPRSTAAPASVPAVGRTTASPSAEFVAPLYVPAPPVAVPGSEDDGGLLWPGDVVRPTPTVPLRAVIRPA